MKKSKKFLAISFLVIAGVSAIFAVMCLMNMFDNYRYVYSQTYGGDAYTGIQNAAVATAQNIEVLGEAVVVLSGFVFILATLVFTALGIAMLLDLKKDKPVVAAPVASAPMYVPVASAPVAPAVQYVPAAPVATVPTYVPTAPVENQQNAQV